MIPVDHRQLWSIIRAEQDSVRDMGDSGGAAPHECRPANYPAGIQGDSAKQEDHRRRPGPARHPRQEDIQGKSFIQLVIVEFQI